MKESATVRSIRHFLNIIRAQLKSLESLDIINDPFHLLI